MLNITLTSHIKGDVEIILTYLVNVTFETIEVTGVIK